MHVFRVVPAEVVLIKFFGIIVFFFRMNIVLLLVVHITGESVNCGKVHILFAFQPCFPNCFRQRKRIESVIETIFFDVQNREVFNYICIHRCSVTYFLRYYALGFIKNGFNGFRRFVFVKLNQTQL